MTRIHYPVRCGDMLFPQDGRPVVRVRPQEDGTCQLTNIGAGHTTTVASQEIAVARAQRIVRMLNAGSQP